MEQDIAIRLSDRMGHQLVADDPAVDKKVLQVSLTALRTWVPPPTPTAAAARPVAR